MSSSGQVLFEENRCFAAGYGPRSIQFSPDASQLAVGYKDGSIHIVDGLRGPMAGWKNYSIRPPADNPEAGARSLAYLARGKLLVGRDGGSLDLVTFTLHGDGEDDISYEKKSLQPPVRHQKSDGPGGLTLVTVLGADTILASHRRGGAWLADRAAVEVGRPDWRALQDSKQTSAGSGLVCAYALINVRGRYLAVSERGTVHLLDPGAGSILKLVGPPDIGVVADYALVKPPWNEAGWIDGAAPDVRAGGGIYVAADTGLYLVWFKNPEGAMGEQPVVNWSRIALPGVSGRIRAVSYFADAETRKGDDDAAALDQGRHFLWVADSAGDAYMFSTLRETHDKVMETGALADNTYFWRPCGVRHQGTQVMRAFLSPYRPRQADGVRRLLVGQASRNSPIVVSLYGPYPKPASRGERSERAERTGRQQLWDLLVHGGVEELRARFSGGTDAMRVARLFETVADDAHDKLVDFLRRPSATLALDVLRVETKKLQEEAEVARRVGEILQTWTYALIGALHQVPIPIADKPFDGIVRWLGDVEAKLKADDRLGAALAEETFAREIGICIRAANKWGIDGWTYGDRKHDLAVLEGFLLAQATCAGLDSRHLDAMVYGAQLLEQRYDIEAEPRSDGMAVRTSTKTPGVTAWDLQIDDHHFEETDRLAQPRFAAVSWSHGLAVYHLRREEAKLTQSGWRLDRVWPAAPERFDGGPERYSRGVAITRARDDPTTPLLVVVRRAGSPSARERVDLVALRGSLVGGEGLPGPVVNPPGDKDRCEIPEGESVYSILDLEAGLVLLGLKGQSGKARIAMLEIPSAGEAVVSCPEVNLEPASPPGGLDAKNPVWTLSTQRRRGSPASEHHVVIGCDDGSVCLLKIANPQKDEPGEVVVEVEKIGVLGAAVWAAAVRWMPSALGADGEMRVFAGGADGSVLAWQSTTPSDGPRTWTPIWATREKTAIGRIHLFDRFAAGDSDVDEAARRHILLLTYDGHAVVVMDHPEIEGQASATGAPLRVPGQRLDRVRLGMPVLASDALRTNFDDSPWPRILVASGDGRLRFVCLTRLRGTEERCIALARITDRWRSEVGLPDLSKPRSGSGPVAHVRASGMRLHAAMTGACEALRLLPVNWLLAPGSSVFIDDPLTVPRQLSALVKLAKAWDDAYQRDGRDAHWVREPFAEILRYCRRTNDPRLFREVVECVLKRMNHDLAALTEDSKRLTAYEIAESLIEVLESTHGLWLGAIDDLDVRLKIVRAKALLDSRVLYRLGRTEYDPRAGHGDRPARGKRKLEEKRQTVLDLRVTFVSDLVGQGEQLLTLEVIRAVNLTLLRCAKALRSEETTVATASVLDWDTISRFFYRLKAVIARLAHSGAGLSHTLRHEVSRSFALAICCVPDRLLLLTHLLSEANLSFEMFTRVADQLRALPLLGIRIPAHTPEIFAAATIYGQEDRQPEVVRDRMMRPAVVAKVSKEPAALERSFSQQPDILANVFPRSGDGGGWRNEDIVHHWAPWHWLLQELYVIADCLDRQPSRLDTSRLAAFAKYLREHPAPENDRYKDTRGFWESHLNNSAADGWLGWSEKYPRGASEQALRPELLSVLSPALEAWSEGLIKDLGRRLREFRLFEPHASAYGAAGARLLSVARHMRYSAAVLSSIVVGILSHGLLESVAEHVFELAEIARTLDSDRDSRAGRGGGVSSAFAAYLDELKSKAADVPRTLLTLKELLANPDSEAGEERLQSMFERHAAIHGRTPWQVGEVNPMLTAREARFLLIALAEIDNNDRVHGLSSSVSPTATVRIEDRRLCIEVASRTDPTDKENNERLREIVEVETKISQPMSPNPGAIGLSHGTGLYMARLAATLVGWSFRCHRFDPKTGVLTVILSGPPKFLALPE